MFYIIDFYVIFVLIFVLFINLINLKHYIGFKEECKDSFKNYFYNSSENVFLNFKICLIFVLYYLYNINQISTNVDLIFISKFFYFFLFILLFYIKEFSLSYKMFSFEFITIFMFSNFCLFLIIQSDNFLTMYIILESYTLTIASSILLKKIKNKLAESAFTYLILNIIASLFLIYSISYIYFCTGLINFSDLDKIYIFYDIFYYKFLLNYALIMLLISFLIKLSIFPFSLLMYKIYKNLPSIYILYFLTIPKFIFLMILFKISNFIFVILDYKFLIFIYLLIFITAVFHAVISLIHFNFKDIIINVSLSNTPFLVLFVFLKYKFFLVCFINFSFIYFLNLFCIFYFLLFLKIKKTTNIVGLFYLNKQILFCFVIILLSLMSLPPFSNFFVKFYMFYFLIEYKMYYYYFFLSFLNLIIIYCYINILRLLFIKKRNLILKYLVIRKSVSFYVFNIFILLNILYLYLFDLVYLVLNNLLFTIIVH